MNRLNSIKHEFVEFIPSTLDDGIVYVSIEYTTAVHKCCCGCGSKVVTPITPTDWKLVFNGKAISLYPSIGNWSFACRSHYWIQGNRVAWADEWSQEKIDKVRQSDTAATQRYYGTPATDPTFDEPGTKPIEHPKSGLLRKVWRWSFRMIGRSSPNS